jgi:hypothetical protein
VLQLKNETGFAATIFASPDPEGIDSLYTIVKGTFALGDHVVPAEEQVPIVMADEHHGDPVETSIRTPSDIALVKPGTDVLLLGYAHAPGGHAVTEMDVSLAVGRVRKTVRVFGDRFWQSDGVTHWMSAVTPFVKMPLVWERAYGGRDQANGELRAETRNPVGQGYRVQGGQKELHGVRLPNLEDPRYPITSWKHTPPPACFAPIGAHWDPRRSYAGTYDEEWQRQRAPYLPKDFDPRFFQLAPDGLVMNGYLQGGEPVEVVGASPSGILRFQLPTLTLQVTYVVDDARSAQPVHLDTVLIEPDDDRLILVWRVMMRCDKTSLRVREVDVRLPAAA